METSFEEVWMRSLMTPSIHAVAEALTSIEELIEIGAIVSDVAVASTVFRFL